MKVGVVSDTHNNLKNIDLLISIFNKKEVDFVIHTGDITNSSSLQKFSTLNCELYGVYGNNDKNEKDLVEIANRNGFQFHNPPFVINKNKRTIAIFHEPDHIEDFLKENHDLDIILHGHTHRYREEFLDSVLIYNPGESAGMLKGKNAVGIIHLDDISVERIFF